MSRSEEVELTNMCMISDGKGNVLVQNKIGNADWSGWNFPGGHVEKGEYIYLHVNQYVVLFIKKDACEDFDKVKEYIKEKLTTRYKNK